MLQNSTLFYVTLNNIDWNSIVFVFLFILYLNGIRQECPLENVLDEMSSNFGPLEIVLCCKCPVQKNVL